MENKKTEIFEFLKDILGALIFLTKLPLPLINIDESEINISRAFWAFPIIGFAFGLTSGGIILFLATTGHTDIKSTQDFLLMVLTGILGGTAAILFIYAYRLISASKMASFEYFGIPSSFVLGWWFFNEAPWEQLFPGVFVIVFAGMIIIWRDKVKQKSTKVSREIN